MSTRTNLPPQQVIPNPRSSPTSGSMAANITSQPLIMRSLSGMSFSYSWAGTSPIGTVSVEASNDYQENPDGTVKNAGTWNTLPLVNSSGVLVTSMPVSGNTGNTFIDIRETSAWALRTVYTRTSGTGILTSLATGKVA